MREVLLKLRRSREERRGCTTALRVASIIHHFRPPSIISVNTRLSIISVSIITLRPAGRRAAPAPGGLRPKF